ncbi:MAG: amino acid permease [Actinomycetota bacterium]|nr:amino acid permease [Actinomycetota bacterium]MDA3009018.1 amino acid permease [Actinomycetota bacterium]MDA3037817.1 amino acid permease [Actinomycetota bacterium]
MENKEFNRTLTLKSSIYLGLSSMIGAGLFNNIAPTAKISSYGSVLGLLLASTLAIANASSSAQLASLFPKTGGTYLYASKVLGKPYAIIAGAVFIIGKTISCVAIALTVGNYLSPVYGKEIGVVLCLLVFLLSFSGIHKTAEIAKWFVWIIFGLLLFYAVSIISTPNVNLSIPIFESISIDSILLSASIWFFAFTGYSRLATFGEEIKNPKEIIPTAILTGLGVTIFLYFGITWLTLSIISPEFIMNSNTPLLVAMDVSRFSEFSFLIVFASSIAMVSVFLALMPGISRIYVALSRDRVLPKAFSKIHKKFNSAYISEGFVLISVIVGIYSFDVIGSIKLSSFFILIYYAITNFCVIKLKKDNRLYSVAIALYGFITCLIFAISLVAF